MHLDNLKNKHKPLLPFIWLGQLTKRLKLFDCLPLLYNLVLIIIHNHARSWHLLPKSTVAPVSKKDLSESKVTQLTRVMSLAAGVHE